MFVVKDVATDSVSIRVAFHNTHDLFADLRTVFATSVFALLLSPMATSETKSVMPLLIVLGHPCQRLAQCTVLRSSAVRNRQARS